jgi:hypothetical protein
LIRLLALLSLCACASVPQITYVDGGDNCPSAVPTAYADVCCGPVPCKGTNCPAVCNDCAATCLATDLCCPNTQGHAVCRPNLQCQP